MQNRNTNRNSKRKPPILNTVIPVLLVIMLCAGLWFAMREDKIIETDETKEISDSSFEESDISDKIASESPENISPDEPKEESLDPIAEKTKEMIADMTLHEKICQLFIVSPEDMVDTEAVTSPEQMGMSIENYPVGGFIYNKPNFQSKDQVKTLLDGTQKLSTIPLFMTCDEEGGNVERLMSTVGTTKLEPMMTYKDSGTQTAYDNAFTIGSDMKALGFNLDLAPVADVWSNKENTVVGDRAYSDNFSQAAELIPYAVRGFHDSGLACAIKHFPGHGNTSEDSHYILPYISKNYSEIKKEELLPFNAGIQAGTDMVMVGHLVISDIDESPVLFSKKWIEDILRQEMAFDGVVISDGMKMQAVTNNFSNAEAAVRAIKAGTDILLLPNNFKSAVNALTEAVNNGEISEDRIDQSLHRILELKIKRNIL